MGTVSFPVTWMVSTKLDRMHTAARGQCEPRQEGIPGAEAGQKGGQAPAPLRLHSAAHPPASFHSCFRSSCRTVMDRGVPIPHSRAQKEIPFWAHVHQALREGPPGHHPQLPPQPVHDPLHARSLPSGQLDAGDAAGDEQLQPGHGPQLQPLAGDLMTKAPPLTWISSVP